RAGQPPALRPCRLRLHREWPPREPDRRPRRKWHGRNQHLRHQRRRHAVRRGQRFRLRQRGRQGRARELSGREGGASGLNRAVKGPVRESLRFHIELSAEELRTAIADSKGSLHGIDWNVRIFWSETSIDQPSAIADDADVLASES